MLSRAEVSSDIKTARRCEAALPNVSDAGQSPVNTLYLLSRRDACACWRFLADVLALAASLSVSRKPSKSAIPVIVQWNCGFCGVKQAQLLGCCASVFGAKLVFGVKRRRTSPFGIGQPGRPLDFRACSARSLRTRSGRLSSKETGSPVAGCGATAILQAWGNSGPPARSKAWGPAVIKDVFPWTMRLWRTSGRPR